MSCSGSSIYSSLLDADSTLLIVNVIGAAYSFTDAEIFKFYDELLVADFIYTFKSRDVSRVIELRKVFVDQGLLTPVLSLQEMTIVWVPLGYAQMKTYPILSGNVFGC